MKKKRFTESLGGVKMMTRSFFISGGVSLRGSIQKNKVIPSRVGWRLLRKGGGALSLKYILSEDRGLGKKRVRSGGSEGNSSSVLRAVSLLFIIR